MNKSVKKIIVTSASLLMMASVGAGVGSLSRPAHAASQAELAKIFASKDPNKALAQHEGKMNNAKMTPTEQKQQDQELAAAEKQGQKAAIMQEEEGAHVNASQAKILNAGSMALSKANGKLADKLNKALQHNDYKLIKRLTAKVNAQNQPSKKTTRRHKTHKHAKKSKRTAKKRNYRAKNLTKRVNKRTAKRAIKGIDASHYARALGKSNYVLRHGRRHATRYIYRTAKKFNKANNAEKKAYRRFARKHTNRNRKAVNKAITKLSKLVNALLK